MAKPKKVDDLKPKKDADLKPKKDDDLFIIQIEAALFLTLIVLFAFFLLSQPLAELTDTEEVVPALPKFIELPVIPEKVPEVATPEEIIPEKAPQVLLYINEDESYYESTTKPMYSGAIYFDPLESNANSVEFDLLFDSSVLPFLSVSLGFDAMIAGKGIVSKKINSGRVNTSISGTPEKLFKKGKIATVTFINVVPGAESEIAFENVKVIDSEGNELKVASPKASVTLVR